MLKSFQDYLQLFRPRLDEAFQDRLSLIIGGPEGNGYADLRTALAGGKRIRGCLLFMVCDLLGGAPDAALPRAVAVELIHAASLVHDDFIDQHKTRRRLPAVWTFEGARSAVLLGDVIFASAIEMMSELSREDGLVASRAIAQVAKGAFSERLDPLRLAGEIERGRLDRKIYEEIISLKTGMLFGAACKLGAVSAGIHGQMGEDLYQYGAGIGEAYQIADDLQEIKHHLRTRSIDSTAMSALTPTLCYFVEDIVPHILPVLTGKRAELDREAFELFRMAQGLMEDEIERRLNSAVSSGIVNLSGDASVSLLTTAPRDLIAMFSQS